MSLQNVPRCQHIKVNGTQCGSPALRNRRFCYFHDSVYLIRQRILQDDQAKRPFSLPLLEDANSIQVALMKVMHLLGSGLMDHKTAGLMLYALQTATSNLRNMNLEVRNKKDVVIDTDSVDRTCIEGHQWFEKDFPDPPQREAGEEEAVYAAVEEKACDEGEGQIAKDLGAKDVKGETANKPCRPRLAARKIMETVTVEEARRLVREAARNGLMDAVGVEARIKPG
jgi:hypothetical protein